MSPNDPCAPFISRGLCLDAALGISQAIREAEKNNAFGRIRYPAASQKKARHQGRVYLGGEFVREL